MLKKTWRRNRKIEFLKIYHRLISISLFFPFAQTLCILRKNVTGNEKSEVSPNQQIVLLSGKWEMGPVGQACSFSAFLQLLGQGDNANPSVWCPGGQNNKNLKKVCLCFVSVARCHGTPQELAPEFSPNTSKHNTHENIHSGSIIHNSPQLETNQRLSSREQTNKMWSIHSGTPLSSTKECNIDTHNNPEEPQKHYAE